MPSTSLMDMMQVSSPLILPKGTGDGGRVSANGRVYKDSVAYAIVKNQNGRVKAYKENIYRRMDEHRFIASCIYPFSLNSLYLKRQLMEKMAERLGKSRLIFSMVSLTIAR